MNRFPIVAIVAATSISLAACGSSNDGLSDSAAKTACETWVDQALGAQGDHQTRYDRQAWEVNGGWRIKSYVDTSAGRYDYECKVTSTDSGDPDVVVEYLELAQ